MAKKVTSVALSEKALDKIKDATDRLGWSRSAFMDLLVIKHGAGLAEQLKKAMVEEE